MAAIQTYSMSELAAIDNHAMHIWAEYASGDGMDAWNAWTDARRINDLPEDVAEAIERGDYRDHAQADYGGGSEATDWYEMHDGSVYAVPTSDRPRYWPTSDTADVPEISNYDPCGGRYSECDDEDEDA